MSTQPTILIVDDEVRSLETLRRMLEDDFHIETAVSVKEAERILGREWVQIILCDQRMPEISGAEFLQQVREKWPEVIRMIISGYTDSEDIISALNEARIYQYIPKPWHPDNLILTLKNAARLFERANGGSVFLDEIGEVSPAFQVKLLRVLQEGEIRPLGSGRTRKVNVRIIAATNKDLEAEVRDGRFREDLYYRLATVTIPLPPLRERRVDIPTLAESLLETATGDLGKKVRGFSNEALACMQAYHWPGNVRELQSIRPA